MAGYVLMPNKIIIKCVECGSPRSSTMFQFRRSKNHFCSSSCSNRFHNALRRKPKLVCSVCLGVVKKRDRLRCSYRCAATYNKQKRFENIVASKETPPRPRAARLFLLNRNGNTCSICGLRTWRGQPTPLVLDHIDGNSDNWKLKNLRLVCPNCDAQLPTYKSKNRGKGRYYRRKRYAEGKSY
jgi:hypothetical protein